MKEWIIKIGACFSFLYKEPTLPLLNVGSESNMIKDANFIEIIFHQLPKSGKFVWECNVLD